MVRGADRIESIYVHMDNKQEVPYEDVLWLIDELEKLEDALSNAEKHLNCTDKQKFERNKYFVLLRIKKALIPWREEGIAHAITRD